MKSRLLLILLAAVAGASAQTYQSCISSCNAYAAIQTNILDQSRGYCYNGAAYTWSNCNRVAEDDYRWCVVYTFWYQDVSWCEADYNVATQACDRTLQSDKRSCDVAYEYGYDSIKSDLTWCIDGCGFLPSAKQPKPISLQNSDPQNLSKGGSQTCFVRLL